MAPLRNWNHPHRSHQTDWSRRRRPLRPPHNQDLLQSRSVGTHHRHTDQTLRSSQILRLKTRALRSVERRRTYRWWTRRIRLH